MSQDDEQYKDDIEYSRRVYHDLLAKGSEALEEMIEVARATEHPRAFEVLSNMIKNVSDVNGSLIDLHKKKKDISSNPQQQQIGNTTNNLFIGSTTDLQRLLHKENAPDIIDVNPTNNE